MESDAALTRGSSRVGGAGGMGAAARRGSGCGMGRGRKGWGCCDDEDDRLEPPLRPSAAASARARSMRSRIDIPAPVWAGDGRCGPTGRAVGRRFPPARAGADDEDRPGPTEADRLNSMASRGSASRMPAASRAMAWRRRWAPRLYAFQIQLLRKITAKISGPIRSGGMRTWARVVACASVGSTMRAA